MLVACIMIGLSLWSLLQTFQRHQKAEEALAQTEATLHLTQDQFQQVKAEHERSGSGLFGQACKKGLLL